MLKPIDYIPACVAGLEMAIFGAEKEGAPVVFVTHGRTGAAVHVYDYCRDLARDGLIAIAVEQRNHGRRMINFFCNDGWSLHHATDMYSIQLGTAMDVSLLIDFIPARLGLSMERVGMTGFSLGGHSTMLAMALDERIQVGAPVIGGGDYRHLMEKRAEQNNCPPGEFATYFPPALEAAVAKFDPISHPERFADRPLLMANGAIDNLVPISCNERFEAAARPFYTKPERLKLSAYEGYGHEMPPAMWDEVRGWLASWLLG